MLLVTYAPQGPYTLEGMNITVELPIEPAGTPLLDRVAAVGLDGGLAVTGPDGVEAEVLDGDGAALETLPLQNGGGIGPLAHPDEAHRVRVLDTDGGVVAEAEIIRVD